MVPTTDVCNKKHIQIKTRGLKRVAQSKGKGTCTSQLQRKKGIHNGKSL